MKNVASSELIRLILRTVEVYNRYRSPEATTKLLKFEEDGFTIEFKGPFCQSCGVQDYFEDFVYELRGLNNNVEVEIRETEQISPQSFKVRYVVKGGFSSGKPDEKESFQEFLREKGLTVDDYMASNPCTKDIIRFHFRTWLFERKSKRTRQVL